MSNKLKIIIGSLIVVGILVVSLVIFLFISIFDFADKNVLKETEIVVMETKEKYDFTKPIEELHLGKLDNYVDYVTELSKQLKPIELRELVIIDINYVAVFKNSYYAKQRSGEQILKTLSVSAYEELLNRVTTPNSDWTGLPLTENFRSKYNEKDSAVGESKYLQHSNYGMSMSGFSLDNKKFAMIYSQWKDNQYGGNEEVEYLDWYSFILDEEGYLDDVIFDHTEEIPRSSYDE